MRVKLRPRVLQAMALSALIPLGRTASAQSAAPQTPATVPASQTAITLDDAIRRAEANEPAFAAAMAEGRATALERKDARAALLPSATFHNQYLFTESNHTTTTLGTAGGQFDQQGIAQSLPVFVANNSVHEYYSQGVVNETVGLAQVAAIRVAGE